MQRWVGRLLASVDNFACVIVCVCVFLRCVYMIRTNFIYKHIQEDNTFTSRFLVAVLVGGIGGWGLEFQEKTGAQETEHHARERSLPYAHFVHACFQSIHAHKHHHPQRTYYTTVAQRRTCTFSLSKQLMGEIASHRKL